MIAQATRAAAKRRQEKKRRRRRSQRPSASANTAPSPTRPTRPIAWQRPRRRSLKATLRCPAPPAAPKRPSSLAMRSPRRATTAPHQLQHGPRRSEPTDGRRRRSRRRSGCRRAMPLAQRRLQAARPRQPTRQMPRARAARSQPRASAADRRTRTTTTRLPHAASAPQKKKTNRPSAGRALQGARTLAGDVLDHPERHLRFTSNDARRRLERRVRRRHIVDGADYVRARLAVGGLQEPRHLAQHGGVKVLRHAKQPELLFRARSGSHRRACAVARIGQAQARGDVPRILAR